MMLLILDYPKNITNCDVLTSLESVKNNLLSEAETVGFYLRYLDSGIKCETGTL